MRILLVEDHPKMADFIRQGLQEHGYAVDGVATAEDAEAAAAGHAYDAIVLDVMLPGASGLDVCRSLRKRHVRTPILMLTALSTTADKVRGLDSGADDYLTKPFEFDELIARLRALLRRGQDGESACLRFADVEMDLVKRLVSRGTRTVSLTAREFSLLEYFLRNPGRLLTRTAIGEHVWDTEFDNESNVIDVYVSALRRKLEAGGEPRLVRTVIGSGYVLKEEGQP